MLTTSVSSLSSSGHLHRSSRPQSSRVAYAYRQAAQLFLTRRLPEALSTIEPVVSPKRDVAAGEDVVTNGHDAQHDGWSETTPIATASRGTRVKVWSFYVSLLNAIVELGPEQGKAAFGIARWQALVRKVREGEVWEEVVKVGYAGEDGAVDADVVINLATLLLTHAPHQTLTQQKLESYLSASAHPTFDLTSHFAATTSPLTPTSPHPSQAATPTPAGTSTPRDLHARLKLLELYALHVLPRNGEWGLARAFLEGSELLDEERRDAFVGALDGLRREAADRERDEARAEEEERRRQQRTRADEERERLRREDAEQAAGEARSEPTGAARPKDPPPTSTHATARGVRPSSAVGPSAARSPPHAHAAAKRNRNPPPQRPPAGLARRVGALLRSIPGVLGRAAVMRAVMMVLLVWILIGRKREMQAVREVLWVAWRKVLGTVGMGVKVSYI